MYPSPGRAWLLALAFALALGMVWWALMPPWTAPDEPGHYLYTRLLADLGPAMVSSPPTTADLRRIAEGPILTSLAGSNWWGYLGRPTPDPLPPRLSADPTLAASGVQLADEPLLFYILPAVMLRLLPLRLAGDPAVALRWLRLWPLALRLGAVVLALYLAGRKWPQQPARVLGLGLLVGGLPMVAFIGGSLNNEALALFWGALAFTLIALPGPFSRLRLLFTALVFLAGPLWVDASLVYLWPLALVQLSFCCRRAWIVWLGGFALLLLLLTPMPGWAAGWRRQPALASTRAGASLAAFPARGPQLPASTLLIQYISGKEVLNLRGQSLELKAEFQDNVQDVLGSAQDVLGSASAELTLTLADDNHTASVACASQPQTPCRLGFTPAPDATFLRLSVDVRQPARFHLRLTGASGRNLLFNGSGTLPDRLGSPLLTVIERWLPVPAGYFAQALSPAAWDAPAQFRYLLFGGFTWASFWGYFGWLSRPFPWPIYVLLAAATLAAAWGLLRSHAGSQLKEKPAPSIVHLSVLALALLLAQTWLPMIGQSWQPQGRYLLPGLLPIAILLLLGWEAALPARWRPRLPLLLAVGLSGLNFLAWRIVA